MHERRMKELAEEMCDMHSALSRQYESLEQQLKHAERNLSQCETQLEDATLGYEHQLDLAHWDMQENKEILRGFIKRIHGDLRPTQLQRILNDYEIDAF